LSLPGLEQILTRAAAIALGAMAILAITLIADVLVVSLP